MFDLRSVLDNDVGNRSYNIIHSAEKQIIAENHKISYIYKTSSKTILQYLEFQDYCGSMDIQIPEKILRFTEYDKDSY